MKKCEKITPKYFMVSTVVWPATSQARAGNVIKVLGLKKARKIARDFIKQTGNGEKREASVFLLRVFYQGFSASINGKSKSTK